MNAAQVKPPPRLILMLGADWWGSDARALAAALRRQGHAVIEVCYEDYFPNKWTSLPLKILRRLIRPLCARDYNRAVLRHASNPAIELMLVFKGMLLTPETLAEFRQPRLRKFCFYPDVSYLDHGRNIWDSLPLYDGVITTKSFHMTDERLRSHVRALHLVLHGYDRDVHRPIQLTAAILSHYACDASFVGCWSESKERHIAAILRTLPRISLRIWGPGWERAGEHVRGHWEGRGVYGDELIAVVQASRINLGLLSEAGTGTTEGDKTTARTWQIPACGGFMLHQASPEFSRFFDAAEVPSFDSPEQLADLTQYFLMHADKRGLCARLAHLRVIDCGYHYDRAASEVIRIMTAKVLPRSEGAAPARESSAA